MSVKPLSLKARAIAWLAQREHSRQELRRKLLRLALQASGPSAQSQALAADGEPCGRSAASVRARDAWGDVDEGDPAIGVEPHSEPLASEGDTVNRESATAEVDSLLDWLEARHYLCETRFAESRVHARQARYGAARIRQELAGHGVTLDPALRDDLQRTERDRAHSVWMRKFGQTPSTAAERAKQMRFLAGRGFAPDVIRQVIQASDSWPGDDESSDFV